MVSLRYPHGERENENMQMGLGTLLVGLPVLAPVLAVWGLFIYVIILVIRALKKYINGGDSRPETAAVRKSLGEAIKARRTECNMTQEFVAGELGVSRQAVSKWESGASDPSTANLLALCKLFGVSAEELLRGVE